MSDNKKDQILAAASECFARFGYKKTTLEDIGKKIGLDKTSIYYYFKSKEEIFSTIVINEFQQFITKLQQDIANDMDCEQKIQFYFIERLRYATQKAMILPQIVESELEKLKQTMTTSGIDVYLRIEQEEKSFVANILQNCIKNGYIKDCSIEKTSKLIFAIVEGVKTSHWTFSSNKVLSSTEFENMIKDIQTVLKIFINGLK